MNSSLWDGGPLSDFTLSGVPNIEHIACSFGMVALADVDDTISANGSGPIPLALKICPKNKISLTLKRFFDALILKFAVLEAS